MIQRSVPRSGLVPGGCEYSERCVKITGMKTIQKITIGFAGMLIVGLSNTALFAGEKDAALKDAKPVPKIQILPRPYDQASFMHGDRELTRAHWGKDLRRPFLYPIIGPSGRSLTRMGHPHDPVGHSHHNSVWITHHKVNGVNFWTDHTKDAGRIVHVRVEQFMDGKQTDYRSAVMLSTNHWKDATGKVLLEETRRVEVQALDDGEWMMTIALQFAPGSGMEEVTFEQNPFGVIGVRMAKTIGVRDGGGRILNSHGQQNEKEVFRKPTKWVDYAGMIRENTPEGIMLMDHPQNVNHPAPFHVRDDGWMGACLTLDKAITLKKDDPLKLMYRLYVHKNAPGEQVLNKVYDKFTKVKYPVMKRVR